MVNIMSLLVGQQWGIDIVLGKYIYVALTSQMDYGSLV